jgi:hypothetical protein
MSVTSGEFFAPPSRPADFTLCGGKAWMPTETEAAQLRWQAFASEENQGALTNDYFMPVERVAAFGMREVFKKFGIRSFHTSRTDSESPEKPTTIHEFGLALPSSAHHAKLVDDFADASQKIERFRVQHCAGKYDGLDLPKALGDGKLLVSTDGEVLPTESNHSDYYLNLYPHDLAIHFTAWLCLPPDLSLRIRRQANDTINNYSFAQRSSDLNRVIAAGKKVDRFGFWIDQAVSIWRMDEIIGGATDRYNESMAEVLEYKDPNYAAKTVAHIKNPNENQVLAARRLAW